MSFQDADSVERDVRIVVLAGGRSGRMGRDKRLLKLGGKTLLRWAVDAGRSLKFPISIVRRDAVPGYGPLGGMVTALRHFPDATLLFVPCDMPFLTSALLARVIRQGAESGNAVACQVAGRIGFPIFLPQQAGAIVEQQCNTGDRSVRGVLKALGALALEWDPAEEWRFLNLNTLDDLEIAQRRLRDC